MEFAGLDTWVNQTIPTTQSYVDFNFHDLFDMDPLLWVSNTSAQRAPSITLFVYKEAPNNIHDDIVAQVNNLVYANVFYLKVEYEDDYISEWLRIGQQKEADSNAIRGGLVAMGWGMILIAPLTAGVTGVWGAELCSQGYTGTGIFDHLIKGSMRVINSISEILCGDEVISESYIEDFTIWHITSDRTLDLILQEVLAEGISMGIGGLFGGVSHMATSTLTARVAGWLARNTLLDIDRIARVSRVVGAAARIVQEYLEIVSEVIVEMVFDNMLNLEEGERPMGGSTQFMTLMTLSILTNGLLSAVARGQGWSIGTRTFNDRTIAILTISTLGVGLSIAQAVARIPVLEASARI